METDFRNALRELRAEERRLEDELQVIRRTLPGLELMASRMPPEENSHTVRYAKMGTKQAIMELLKQEDTNTLSKSLTAAQIAQLLLAGGIQTKSTDYVRSVSTTLSQLGMDGLVERVEDRWKIKKDAAESVEFDGIRDPLTLRDIGIFAEN